MDKEKYLKKHRKHKENYLRYRLGFLQLIHKPILNLLLIPIIATFIGLWIEKKQLLTFLNVPELIFPIFRYTLCIISLIIPIIILLWLIKYIGELSARKDEADLQQAFTKEELRNSSPILMDKKKVNGSDVTMREFYSSIPLDTWNTRKNAIADLMNIHFVEEIQYGGKADGRRIIIFTAPGRIPATRGNLYDEEF
jgi:hypothetical protein